MVQKRYYIRSDVLSHDLPDGRRKEVSVWRLPPRAARRTRSSISLGTRATTRSRRRPDRRRRRRRASQSRLDTICAAAGTTVGPLRGPHSPYSRGFFILLRQERGMMGCIGCFNDFGGEFGIIDDLDEILWVDEDDLNPPPPPLLGRKLLNRRKPDRFPAVQHHSTARWAVFVF